MLAVVQQSGSPVQCRSVIQLGAVRVTRSLTVCHSPRQLSCQGCAAPVPPVLPTAHCPHLLPLRSRELPARLGRVVTIQPWKLSAAAQHFLVAASCDSGGNRLGRGEKLCCPPARPATHPPQLSALLARSQPTSTEGLYW